MSGSRTLGSWATAAGRASGHTLRRVSRHRPFRLHALAKAGEPAPFVVVGLSLGGPYALIFTDRYPADVAGLVFVVDAVRSQGKSAQ